MSDIPSLSELDQLADLLVEDPNNEKDLIRLIAGMRAYRAQASSKGGKATKFSDESGIKAADIMKIIKKSEPPKEKMRRL